MAKAYVLMTAMPPTKGHLRLIEFAALLSERAEVILCTQPGEPFTAWRMTALLKATEHMPNVHFNLIHQELPQEPEGHEGFWDMWAAFLRMFGFEKGDYIVASEDYGKRLAEEVDGRFMPYDIDRELYPCKATQVRKDPWHHFDKILPEFQPQLRQKITIFGAESTGKTTLTRGVAASLDMPYLFEYARPYLEHGTNEISTQTMTEIWQGQLALQKQESIYLDKPVVFQDTDLFSTVGYWEMSPWSIAGQNKVPSKIIDDAYSVESDLYIVLLSNIDYEPDPLRYGGDHREITDEKWIDFCERYGLNYVILDTPFRPARKEKVWGLAEKLFWEQAEKLSYQRIGREYEAV